MRESLRDRWWRVSLRSFLTIALASTALGLPAAVAQDAPSLAMQVQIRRTQYGVPHIQGETLEAAAFGFGYCQAEDHLPNILRGIVGVRSELAATFGPDATAPGDNKNLEADFFNRQFRVYSRAVDTYHKLDPDYRAMCEGFAAGLNYYLDKHRASVPDWAPTITGHDVVAYGMAGVMRFAFNRDKEIDKFFKRQGVAAAAIDDGSDAEVGSNMWALAPSRSRSGRTILMCNPHQAWAPVSTYYEAHMIVPGRMNFYGSTFIGRPVLTSGWNEFLGWSHTVNYPDLEEIYELELDAARPDHYRFDGGAVPLEKDEVQVLVLKDGQKAAEMRTFWHTPLGPAIHRSPTHAYVLRNASWENFRAYEQWLKMTQAKNYAEFRRTVEMNQLPMFNICYADRVGNIFYLWNGTVPKLPHAAHKGEAVPARRSADVWTEFLQTAELPQLFNPPGGYVQNCNSPPFFTNLRAPLDPAKFPPYFPANNVSLRSQHSLRLVDNDLKFSLEEVRDRKHSPGMLLAERVKGDLIAALRSMPATSELEAAIATLESWDNTVTAESRGGTLFTAWWNRYLAAGGKHAVEWSAAEPTSTPRGLADAELAKKSFVAALDDVREQYGRADVSWGDSHRVRKQGVDLPLSGGSGLMGCFRVLDFRTDEDGKQVAMGGDSFVFAVEFSEPPRAYSVLAYSQSEIEGAPHYSDQAALFSAGQMKSVAFTDAEIAAQLLKQYRPGEE